MWEYFSRIKKLRGIKVKILFLFGEYPSFFAFATKELVRGRSAIAPAGAGTCPTGRSRRRRPWAGIRSLLVVGERWISSPSHFPPFFLAMYGRSKWQIFIVFLYNNFNQVIYCSSFFTRVSGFFLHFTSTLKRSFQAKVQIPHVFPPSLLRKQMTYKNI